MKAVIMAGGLGTRLRPLTLNIPKPMVPMANRPIMEHIIELLKRHKIASILAILYYQPEIIKDYFKDGQRFGVKISYVSAEEDLGTAGSVKNAEAYLDESFIVISGDVLTDFNLTSAMKFHRTSEALATIALTRVSDPLSYGIVIVDDAGRIVRFLEKPSWGEVFSDTINTGIYILEPEVFSYIPKGNSFDFSKNLFPYLLKRGKPLFGYIAKGYWRDIGNLTEYRLAHYDILREKIKLGIPGRKARKGRGNWARVDKGSKLNSNVTCKGGVIIGRRCRIAEGAILNDCIIGDGCVIEKGANISNSILWDKTRIGKGAELKENVVATGSYIKDRAFLQAGAILSEGCVVGRNSAIRANVKVWPNKVVEDGATLSTSLIWGEKWTRSLFGTHGVTGLANVEISPEFASRLGAAYGASFPLGSLLMTSRNNEKVCRMINRAIMTGILSVGVNVGDLRAIPIPVARHQIRSGAQGGIHIRRASGNPKLLEIQFFDENGLNIPPGKEKAVEQLFFREDFRRATPEETGEISFPYRVIEYYKEAFLDNIDTALIAKRGFKIVIDYGFGEAVGIFPSILGELGCEVVALDAHLDPARAIKTRQEVEKSLEQLSNIVLTLGADIGFLLDPEAEMVSLVSEKGKIISSDLALAILSWLVGKIHPEATIAVPATASRIIEEIIPRVKRTKTTSRAIMDEGDVYLAGNARGGFIFPHFQPAFDGMFAVAKILELLSQQKTTLARVAREIPAFRLIHERVPCPWEAKGRIMRHLTEMTSREERELADGIKVYYGKDWVFLLPSTNRSLFHVFSEANSIKKAKELSRRFAREIKRLSKEEI